MDNWTTEKRDPYNRTQPQSTSTSTEHEKPVPESMPQIYSHRLIEAVTEDPLTVEEYLHSHRAQRLLVEKVVAIADVLASISEEDDINTQALKVDCIIHRPLISVLSLIS